ncbi:MAG: hypothetical protein SFV17_22195 [Candidatus Obscuribacter sp.]|nr:hypothetical protein [Candidatus Obscuribacter sp.]
MITTQTGRIFFGRQTSTPVLTEIAPAATALKGKALTALAVTMALTFAPASAQQVNPGLPGGAISPIRLVDAQRIAAQPTLPSLVPTDVTPIGLGRERELLKPGPTFYLLQKLPSRMWLNGSVEVSQRGETNVFFTNSNRKADYVFRVLPNLSVGYRILPRTSIYTNYFVLKDVFADHGRLSYPTTQSLAWGIRHEIPIRTRTNLQFDLQAREIWQASNFRQFDFLPGVTLTHVLNPSTIAFGNIQLQLRGKNYFCAPTREIDPFYTIGILHRRGMWTFSAVDTFVCNFRNGNAIPSQSNLSMIAQLEIARQVTKKVPGLVTFVRAEPVFNWASRGLPGISGFDFRIFGGLRYSFNKAATNVAMDQLRKQLKESSLPPAMAPSDGKAPTDETASPLKTMETEPAMAPLQAREAATAPLQAGEAAMAPLQVVEATMAPQAAPTPSESGTVANTADPAATAAAPLPTGTNAIRTNETKPVAATTAESWNEAATLR